MTEFLTQLIDGLTLGALFALVAVGYTMVFGIIKLINFAHGEFYMVGGFVGMLALLMLASQGGPLAGLPGTAKLILALGAAASAVALLAVLTERFAYRPVLSGGRISALLTAVGMSLLLQNVGITVFGAKQTAFPETIQDERYPRTVVQLSELSADQIAPWTIKYRAMAHGPDGEALVNSMGLPMGYQVTLAEAGKPINAKKLERARTEKPEAIYAYPAVTVSKKQLIVFFALGMTAAGLYVLVQRTRVGRAMRAVSHDTQAAALMGINCERIVMLTFATGGALAGLGGVMAGGMFISTVDPMMGFLFGLKAFIAAVLGGIGSIPGALLGGLALGLIEQFAQNYADAYLFAHASSYRDAIAFVILIVVLLIRPSGFLGRAEGEKV